MKRQKNEPESEAMTMLKRHRLAKGLTTAELAKRIGASQAAVSTWETGRSLPHPRVIPRLARVLGIKPLELLKLLSPELAVA